MLKNERKTRQLQGAAKHGDQLGYSPPPGGRRVRRRRPLLELLHIARGRGSFDVKLVPEKTKASLFGALLITRLDRYRLYL